MQIQKQHSDRYVIKEETEVLGEKPLRRSPSGQ